MQLFEGALEHCFVVFGQLRVAIAQAPLESLPSSFPLDAVAVSELLAGVEVELGEERGKTAAALERNELLEQALKKAQRLAIMYPVLAGAIGTVLGAIIGAVAVFIGTSVR